jgi:hypothetical protein
MSSGSRVVLGPRHFAITVSFLVMHTNETVRVPTNSVRAILSEVTTQTYSDSAGTEWSLECVYLSTYSKDHEG